MKDESVNLFSFIYILGRTFKPETLCCWRQNLTALLICYAGVFFNFICCLLLFARNLKSAHTNLCGALASSIHGFGRQRDNSSGTTCHKSQHHVFSSGLCQGCTTCGGSASKYANSWGEATNHPGTSTRPTFRHDCSEDGRLERKSVSL